MQLAQGVSLARRPLTDSLTDGIEALVGLGQLESARALIGFLEEGSEPFDGPSAQGAGARCRALLLAACGDIPAALRAVQAALALHQQLGLTFELARTLLVAGLIQRRAGDRRAAKQSLEKALDLFEELRLPLWARKTRLELARIGLRGLVKEELSPTERSVAELAATGLTNRLVADALFVSPKTVESNLARVYSKLGIHSRAELGARMAQANLPQDPLGVVSAHRNGNHRETPDTNDSGIVLTSPSADGTIPPQRRVS